MSVVCPPVGGGLELGRMQSFNIVIKSTIYCRFHKTLSCSPKIQGRFEFCQDKEYFLRDSVRISVEALLIGMLAILWRARHWPKLVFETVHPIKVDVVVQYWSKGVEIS